MNVSQLQEWCFTAGLPYIRKLQSIYDDHHDEFERQVDAAKKYHSKFDLYSSPHDRRVADRPDA